MFLVKAIDREQDCRALGWPIAASTVIVFFHINNLLSTLKDEKLFEELCRMTLMRVSPKVEVYLPVLNTSSFPMILSDWSSMITWPHCIQALLLYFYKKAADWGLTQHSGNRIDLIDPVCRFMTAPTIKLTPFVASLIYHILSSLLFFYFCFMVLLTWWQIFCLFYKSCFDFLSHSIYNFSTMKHQGSTSPRLPCIVCLKMVYIVTWYK